MIERKIKVIIYGKVQGVYFRYHTKLMADKFDLNGWVRNRSDGSVEAYFKGNGSNIARMIEWLHHGPETAVVEKVDIADIGNQELQADDFIIKF